MAIQDATSYQQQLQDFVGLECCRLGVLGLTFFVGVLLQFLGCALWHNWWPMLTAFMYVLVPMPYLFFGPSESSYGSNLASSWVDAGKFLTGFSAVGSFAIPAILYHSQKIVFGALFMEIAAMCIMGGTLVAYQFLSERESGGFGYY